MIRVDLVDHDCALLATVADKVCLPIAVEIKPPGEYAFLHRPLPDRRSHGLSTPLYVTWQTNIYGDDDSHCQTPGIGGSLAAIILENLCE
jgi:hypothetical protein